MGDTAVGGDLVFVSSILIVPSGKVTLQRNCSLT